MEEMGRYRSPNGLDRAPGRASEEVAEGNGRLERSGPRFPRELDEREVKRDLQSRCRIENAGAELEKEVVGRTGMEVSRGRT